MKKPFATLVLGISAVFLLCATSLQANQVMVQELQVSPTEIATISVPGFYSGQVYAGVNRLLVGGTPMDGFCIDPFHFSSFSPLLYTVVPLSQAPKAPGTMNAMQADQIAKLWAMFYSTSMTTTNAAGLQIAIWEIVAGNRMSVTGSDFGAQTMLTSMSTYTGAGADLVGLTGPGQDYVVRRVAGLSTPDHGSALGLLSLGVAFLGIASRFQNKHRLVPCAG